MLCYAQSFHSVLLFAIPWTVAHQAPLSMGFPDQEYYSELPFPAPSSALIQEKFPAEYVITSLGSPFLWGFFPYVMTFFVVLIAQSCPTLCNPMDCSPPGASVHGILQAILLEQIARLSSRGSSPPRDRTHVSYVSCISSISRRIGYLATWEAPPI